MFVRNPFHVPSPPCVYVGGHWLVLVFRAQDGWCNQVGAGTGYHFKLIAASGLVAVSVCPQTESCVTMNPDGCPSNPFIGSDSDASRMKPFDYTQRSRIGSTSTAESGVGWVMKVVVLCEDSDN